MASEARRADSNHEGQLMAAYISNLQHLVWSTLERQSWIGSEWQPRLFEYIGGTIRKHGTILLKAGGMPDHIHLLVSMPATLSIAELVNVIKSNSSRWIHENFPELQQFHWQTKYGAFSVSRSQRPTIECYIDRQPEHHQRRTYQDEFRAILSQHEMEIDERYVWQ